LALGSAGPGEHSAEGKRLVYDMSPGSIDLTLVRAGRCPVLAEHVRSLSCWLGDIVAAVPEDGTLRLALRFAKGGLADEVWGRLADGFKVSPSVGILIQASEEPADGPVRISRWQLTEVSCVVLGRDPKAHLAGPTTDEQVLAMIRLMNEMDYGRRLAVLRKYKLDDWERWTETAGHRLGRMLDVAADEATDALSELVREHITEIEAALA
jgi:hypothetical protein